MVSYCHQAPIHHRSLCPLTSVRVNLSILPRLSFAFSVRVSRFPGALKDNASISLFHPGKTWRSDKVTNKIREKQLLPSWKLYKGLARRTTRPVEYVADRGEFAKRNVSTVDILSRKERKGCLRGSSNGSLGGRCFRALKLKNVGARLVPAWLLCSAKLLTP